MNVKDKVCVVTGASFEGTLDGRAIAMSSPFVVPAGKRLRFGARRLGARATLAVRGGIDVPDVMGSRSTSVVSRMGPLGGRPLAAGDVLPIGSADPMTPPSTGDVLPIPNGGAARGWHAELRNVLGAVKRMYAPGCRAGHHDAPTSWTGDTGQRTEWLGAQPAVLQDR